MSSSFTYNTLPDFHMNEDRHQYLIRELNKMSVKNELNYEKYEVIEFINQYLELEDNCESSHFHMPELKYVLHISGGLSGGGAPTHTYELMGVLDELFGDIMVQWAIEDEALRSQAHLEMSSS
jgi:hypothetical protein